MGKDAGGAAAELVAGTRGPLIFMDLDQFFEALDAERCKGGDLVIIIDIPDPDATVFGLHFHRDLFQPGFVLAEHLGYSGNGEDMARSSHGHAASAIA